MSKGRGEEGGREGGGGGWVCERCVSKYKQLCLDNEV